MHAFIRSVKGKNQDSNSRIKAIITRQLSETVKEIQLSCVEENILGDSLDVEEAANSLCCIVEAIFLHGLKDSLALRFRKAIADVDDRPEPSFWPPLLVVSHRQIIDSIVKCPQLTTEVGQCRAWIRLALNDCLLSSYLLTLRQNCSLLKSYYNAYAYIRDGEMLEVAQKLVQGVEAVKTFDLPCFSSILNSWPQTTLILAGVWSPTLRTCPVQTCVDVAQSTQFQSPSNLNSETASLGSIASLHSRSSGIGNIVALDEEVAFSLVLNKKLSEGAMDIEEKEAKSITEPVACEPAKEEVGKQRNGNTGESVLGNSLCAKSGWSFDGSPEGKTENVPTPPMPVGKASVANAENTNNNTNALEHSYNALIESYNMFGGAYIKTPDIREVWDHFQARGSPSDISRIEKLEKANRTTEGGAHEELTLAQQLTFIAKQKGLDSQNYECAGCNAPITLNRSGTTDADHANLCAFTGKYFCKACMHETQICIPSRMLHNWDHREYRVSKQAYTYIDEIKDHPYIDLKIVNPYIYSVVEDMAKLQIMRNQLNFLRAYLYTCRDPVIEEFQKLMWPREYMYEHVHQYSVLDLQQIPDGTLVQKLKDVVSFGKKHVHDCWLCSHKGFICEVCNSPNVLFPFDTENVYRCDICNAVYHKDCLNEKKPCPKCKRQREREDMTLLGMMED